MSDESNTNPETLPAHKQSDTHDLDLAIPAAHAVSEQVSADMDMEMQHRHRRAEAGMIASVPVPMAFDVDLGPDYDALFAHDRPELHDITHVHTAAPMYPDAPHSFNLDDFKPRHHRQLLLEAGQSPSAEAMANRVEKPARGLE